MGEPFTSYLLWTIFTTGISFVAQELAQEDYEVTPDPGVKVNTRSTQEYLKIIYGKAKVGGNDVYINATGDDNDDLWIVQTLGEGEMDSIAQEDGEDLAYFGDTLVSEFVDAGVAEYWFHGGSNTQTYDTNLNAADSQWTDNMRGTAYIVWHLTYAYKYYQSMPKRQVVVKGLKLFDFRDSTTAWSDNAVLGLYDYMTNDVYGMGLSTGIIDTTSWTSAANYCDTKGWTLNMSLYQDEAAIDVVRRMLNHFRGTLVWYDGKFYLRYADLNYESSVMTIRDYNIAQDESGKAAVTLSQPSRFDKPDGVRIKYIDPDKDYVTDDLIIGDAGGVIKEAKLLGCDNRQQAADLGVYQLERAQLDRTVSGTFSDECLQLEPHDLVVFNSTALSIANQYMRVRSAAVRPDGTVDMTLIYESPVLYDDDYNLDTEGTYTCSLPDPKSEPPSVINVQTEEETYFYRKRNYTRLKISFSEPTNYPWFSHVEVYVSYDNTNWQYLYDVNTDFNIDNVEEGAHYYIRLKVVSLWGNKQTDDNDYKIDRVIAGYTDQPASLADCQIIVSERAVLIYSDKLDDPDIEHYEFRLGSSWSGGIFLAALRAPNLSLDSVKPGAHTFWVNTFSTNDEYGETPRTASATLIDPPDGWTVSDSDTCDYDGVGTHDNTEHTTYNSDDYLKCSHTGGVLTGTYTSPEYDIGSSTRVLVYVLGEIVVTGTGLTWNDKFPSGTTFGEGGVEDNTWVEIFELAQGPSVKMKVKYGDTSGSLTNSVERMEILAAIITGRYFQVEITITDPAEDVNALVEHFTIKYCS